MYIIHFNSPAGPRLRCSATTLNMTHTRMKIFEYSIGSDESFRIHVSGRVLYTYTVLYFKLLLSDPEI